MFALGEHGVEHVPLMKVFYVSNFGVRRSNEEVASLSRETGSLSIVMIFVMVGYFVSTVQAVSAPNVVVTTVYWGTNLLGGVSVHPGDTCIPLSIVIRWGKITKMLDMPLSPTPWVRMEVLVRERD